MRPITRDIRKQIIEEDFGFLNDIKIHEFEGKLMMGTKDIPFNVESVMYESEFIKKWLMSFALGNHYGVNYFNTEGWCALSGNGTRAVMIVNDDLKPVLVIPPLISHNLSAEDFRLLRAASLYMQANSADTTKATDLNANLSIAQQITKNFSERKRMTLTDMVPRSYYEKHSIIPEVEQQVYYIKDVVSRGSASVEDLNRARHILYRNYKKETVTVDEKEFITKLTHGTFQLNQVEQKETTAAEKEENFNPLEC